MRASRHDPLHLDVAAFAAEGQQLSGQWPGSSLARLVEVQVPPQDGALAEVDWQAQGERLAVPGSEPEIWLTLTVSTPVWLTCQRCLQAMALPLTLNRRLRFVSGESQAEAMDAELEDDVLALSRSLDLRDLVEEDRHLAPLCEVGLVVQEDDEELVGVEGIRQPGGNLLEGVDKGPGRGLAGAGRTWARAWTLRG